MKSGKNITLLACDGDGTIWHYPGYYGSSWDAISQAFNLKEECDGLLDYYYSRKGFDEEWAREHASLFKNKLIKEAEKYLYPIPYSKGVVDFFRNRSRDLKTGLVTAGFDIVAEVAKQELRLDFCYSNVLKRNNGIFTGEVEYNVPIRDKHFLFEKVCGNIPKEEIAYVGDAEGDVSFMKKIGLSIAFNPKDEKVTKAADYVIHDFKELTSILNLR